MSRTIKAVERHMIPQAKVLPVRLSARDARSSAGAAPGLDSSKLRLS